MRDQLRKWNFQPIDSNGRVISTCDPYAGVATLGKWHIPCPDGVKCEHNHPSKCATAHRTEIAQARLKQIQGK